MGFDVFNALDLMDNKQFLEQLKFGIGDGNLQYYLYNWRCPTMAPERVRTCIFHLNTLMYRQTYSVWPKVKQQMTRI